jgi:hypothetical protein
VKTSVARSCCFAVNECRIVDDKLPSVDITETCTDHGNWMERTSVMRRLSRLLAISVGLSLALGGPIPTFESRGLARGEDGAGPLTNAIPGPGAEGLHRVPAKTESTRPGRVGSDASGGWWLGTVALALGLAVFGGISLASRRFLPGRDSGPLRVIGRAALSSKHSVCMVRANNRILLIGVGPQGSPSLLGDWAESDTTSPRRNGGAA